MFLIFPGVFICLQVSEAVLMNGVFIEFICSFQIVKMCLSFFGLPCTPSLGLVWGNSFYSLSILRVSQGFPDLCLHMLLKLKYMKKEKMVPVSLVSRPQDGGFALGGFLLGWQELTQPRWSSASIHDDIVYREEHWRPDCSQDLWMPGRFGKVTALLLHFLSGVMINRG